MQVREERTLGRRPVAEGRWQARTERWQGRKQNQDSAAWRRKNGNNNLYAIDEDESENIVETLDTDEELEAWCLLEDSENEQWQEVKKQTRRTTGEDSQSRVTHGCGKQSKIRTRRKSLTCMTDG